MRPVNYDANIPSSALPRMLSLSLVCQNLGSTWARDRWFSKCFHLPSHLSVMVCQATLFLQVRPVEAHTRAVFCHLNIRQSLSTLVVVDREGTGVDAQTWKLAGNLSSSLYSLWLLNRSRCPWCLLLFPAPSCLPSCIREGL